MINPCKTLSVTVLILFIAGFSYTLSAQDLSALMNTVNIGDWIEFKGTPQADFSVLVQEIEVLPEAKSENDWKVSGAISRITREEETIYIMNLPVKLDKNTHYSDGDFFDLKPDMMVEVKGQYTNDGIFIGQGVRRVTTSENENNLIRWTGKIEGVEAENNLINILAHIIVLTPDTRIIASDH